MDPQPKLHTCMQKYIILHVLWPLWHLPLLIVLQERMTFVKSFGLKDFSITFKFTLQHFPPWSLSENSVHWISWFNPFRNEPSTSTECVSLVCVTYHRKKSSPVCSSNSSSSSGGMGNGIFSSWVWKPLSFRSIRLTGSKVKALARRLRSWAHGQWRFSKFDV